MGANLACTRAGRSASPLYPENYKKGRLEVLRNTQEVPQDTGEGRQEKWDASMI